MLLLLWVTGCTFTPGAEGFTTITEATLLGELEATDLVTDLGLTVELERAELRLGSISMQELSGGAVDFDPATPPEGYTLCHGGHCHSVDGALVSYADIILELSGGTASFEEVAAFEGEHVLDLILGDVLALEDELTPSPHLPIADITLAEATWLDPGLVLEGQVQLDDSVAPFSVALTPETPLSGGLSLPVDRDQAALVRVDLSVTLSERFLHDLDLEALLEDGDVTITDPAEPGGIEITEALLATELAGDADPLE